MFRAVAAMGLVLGAGLGVLASPVQAQQKPLPWAEQPLKPEKNPPGDIPDNQVFIEYNSPRGFSFKVPEGWARQDLADGASFADKYGRISVTQSTAAAPPDVNTARQRLLPELEKTASAVKLTKVRSVKLPAGPAVQVSYGSNSEPNPVTNKAIRLEDDRYYFWKDGKLVTLNFSAPAGADNADQWDMMAKSFRWQ
jgi:hypothetical protein